VLVSVAAAVPSGDFTARGGEVRGDGPLPGWFMPLLAAGKQRPTPRVTLAEPPFWDELQVVEVPAVAEFGMNRDDHPIRRVRPPSFAGRRRGAAGR
jgi:hypothetical protein